MPFYDYACGACGPFTEIRPMAEAASPQPCPGCGDPAPRSILRVPNFAMMDGATRHAHVTNERSAHEPKRSGGHGAGCSCCGGKAKPSRTLHRPDGSKSFPSARPWQISH